MLKRNIKKLETLGLLILLIIMTGCSDKELRTTPRVYPSSELVPLEIEDTTPKAVNLPVREPVEEEVAGSDDKKTRVEELTKKYSKDHNLNGVASWYGGKFQGRRTASGEIFDTNTYTAAHKSLPFGTIVRVTNIENKKSVVVKINDRGPYVSGRVIDLSKSAFLKVSDINHGIVDVKIEILDDTKTFRYKH